MFFTYYGTAAAEGWPGLFCECDNCIRAKTQGGRNIRTRSQAKVNEDLLIDMPPDTFHHIAVHGLDLTKLRDILITHNHSDHFYKHEFNFLRPPYAYNSKKEKVDEPYTIYGNESVCAALAGDQNLKEGFIKTVELHAFEPVTIKNYIVTPLNANHDKAQNCLFYIIDDGLKKILYGNDTGYFPDETWDYLKNNHTNGRKFDFVSLDNTCGITENRHHHMGLSTCFEVKEKLIQINAADISTKFILHHFSHNGIATYDELLPIAFEKGFGVSFDGMNFNI